MDYIELLNQIFELCIIPLLGVLTTFVVQYIRQKAKEIGIEINNDLAQKYINMISNTITNCVIATNQTYVETLKKEGKFDAEAQKVALEKTYNAVLAMLSEDCKQYIIEISGDLNTYLINLIEAEVNKQK